LSQPVAGEFQALSDPKAVVQDGSIEIIEAIESLKAL
jgi:hypothetical protein